MEVVSLKYKTTKPNTLYNRENNGKYPWNMREPRSIELPTGTEVELYKCDTATGRYYEIVYRNGRQVFELSQKVDEINYLKK